MLVATDGKAFGLLPALYGPNLPAEVDGNLLPGNEFPVVEARACGRVRIERCSVSRHEGRLGCACEWANYNLFVYKFGKATGQQVNRGATPWPSGLLTSRALSRLWAWW